MNEQLIVKNFGPIKDATVDFKRVTVFIGPTGGGKSTLAKLAAIFRDIKFHSNADSIQETFNDYGISSSFKNEHYLSWGRGNNSIFIENKQHYLSDELASASESIIMSSQADSLKTFAASVAEKIDKDLVSIETLKDETVFKKLFNEFFRGNILANAFKRTLAYSQPKYIPSERIIVASLEYSWAGLMRDDIGLPKMLLDFSNSFSLSRKSVSSLDIAFLNVEYIHIDGRDFIKIPDREEPLMLLETASGIQSVTPLLVLLEHLSHNTEQAQSFIIEEPELNLFPLAQFELVKILVEKCAQTEGKNDLVLTTHSPYVLTALNLLCYAYRIAQQDEATAKKVAKLIPRHCWIDPDQFAAYYVDRPDTKRKQQVRSIINKKTGLIEENELDTASDELGAIFDKLVRLRKPTPTPSRAK